MLFSFKYKKIDIPPMLFSFKYNWVNPVKLRTGSSVPVIPKTATPAGLQLKSYQSVACVKKVYCNRYALPYIFAIATTTRCDSRAHRRTTDAVVGQRQISQPEQSTHWIERACNCPTPQQVPQSPRRGQHPCTNTAVKYNPSRYNTTTSIYCASVRAHSHLHSQSQSLRVVCA
jgi:hypothetical protein